jgi:WD40-like Beta Propeller Repeat
MSLRSAWMPAVALIAAVFAACCGSHSPSPQPTVTVTVPASPGGGSGSGGGLGSSTPGQSSGGEPGIVGVTTVGALVRIDASSGSITQTLVGNGVAGDEVSVSPDGSTIYFTEQAGCHAEVESVSGSGGNLTAIAPGQFPAISPDGTKLAFTSEPVMSETCVPDPSKSGVAASYKLIIRTLRSGAERSLGLPAQVRKGGLLPPISHLSWSADGAMLAVSIAAVADNEGWGVNLVNPQTARYYADTSAGVSAVPVTGSPDAQRSYLREGVYLPDGNLFISRACCGGVPIHNTSRLMWEVSPAGALVHQVAIGFPDLEHVSLSADSSGHWLLYLADHDLYVSRDGNRPSKLTSGLIAAAWG